MIASGTTSFTDMYFNIDAVAEAVAEAGIKANISNGTVALGDGTFAFKQDSSYHENMCILEKYASPKLRLDVGVHAEYTSHPKVWEQVTAFAKENGLNMHVHVSESQAEHTACIEKYGLTPAQILAKHGVFDVPATAAHGVYLTDEDMRLFAEKGVSVAHNPVSNLKLASGIARVGAMLAAGVNVTLGTDGVASNNSTDLFEEIKLASILQKGISGDPTAIPAYEALKMATRNGATAQGRANECGQIAVGFDADIIMIDAENPRFANMYDPVSAVVYNGSGKDVCLTMVAGRVVFENGDYITLDMEKLLFEFKGAVRELQA
jgi:5-methylthioadenosine/S-adenosylhomocysteine deaminase